jgi:hypothetical protein
LGDFKAAAAAFQKGLELEPTNANLKSGLQNAQARVKPEDDTNLTDEDAAAGPSPGLGGMADMLRNMGGGAGGAGGGMPDPANLMGMMNNPAMMQMAQQMMQNGGLEALMSNPAVANMVGDLHFHTYAVVHHAKSDWLVDESGTIRRGVALGRRDHVRPEFEKSVGATSRSLWCKSRSHVPFSAQQFGAGGTGSGGAAVDR